MEYLKKMGRIFPGQVDVKHEKEIQQKQTNIF